MAKVVAYSRKIDSKTSRPAALKTKLKLKKAAAKARKARAEAVDWSDQQFTCSHHRDEDFNDGGLRSFFHYRDLGIAKATKGKVQARVIRMAVPFKAEDVSVEHFHEVQLQLVYVLKGWFRTEFEGHGTITMRQGSCWIQPPQIKHTVHGYSDDCELLEVAMPANFKTVMLG